MSESSPLEEQYYEKSPAYIKWEQEFDGKTVVDLSGKNLTDEDALAIGELLKANNTLERLYLGDNNITNVQSIGDALKTNTTLEKLDLGNNEITDDGGIQSIIDGLKSNNTLEWLELRDNQLSNDMKSKLDTIGQDKEMWLYAIGQYKAMWIYHYSNKIKLRF